MSSTNNAVRSILLAFGVGYLLPSASCALAALPAMDSNNLRSVKIPGTTTASAELALSYQLLLALALAMITRFAIAADQDASFRNCSTQCPEFVMIPAGAFQMGSPKDEAGRSHNEGLVHAMHVDAFSGKAAANGKRRLKTGQMESLPGRPETVGVIQDGT